MPFYGIKSAGSVPWSQIPRREGRPRPSLPPFSGRKDRPPRPATPPVLDALALPSGRHF